MFKNLKLKERIIWGYSIPVILSAISSVVVHIETKIVSDKYKLVDQGHAVVEKLRTGENHFLRMQKAARGFFLTKEDQFFNEYDLATKNFYTAVDEANTIIIDQDQKERVKEAYVLVQEIDRLYRQSIDLTKANKLDQGLKLWRKNIVPLLQKVEALIKVFEDKEIGILSQRQRSAKDDLQFLNTVVLLSTILAALIAIAVSLIIASSITQKVREAVSTISESSTEIAETVSEQERMASNQAVAVRQTTTAMDELGASSRASAQQAEAAAAGAQQVLNLVDGNFQTIEDDAHNWGANSSLRQRVKQIANNILHLSEQTHQIGIISTLVSDLASQTNMLALNAAVEAVRAGDNGKGFAVVAAEIRKLAEQSRKSAEKINTLVTDIKNATHSTVLVADEGTKTVEIIVQAIDNIATNSQQISLTAKQQAIAIEQVVEAMNNINQGAFQSAIGISQTKDTAQKLNEAALNLEAVV